LKKTNEGIMLLINKEKKIDIETQTNEHHFRFCNFFDQRSKELEEKIQLQPTQNYELVDDTGFSREMQWPNLSFWQSYRYLEYQNTPFYLLQMSNLQNDSHYQMAIQVEVSKIPLFQIGTISKWVMTTNAISQRDQNLLINKLLHFCQQHTNLMGLRIQAYMPGNECIGKIYNLLLSKGFNDTNPKSYTMTRMIDLRPPVNELLSSFSANGRARLKIKEKDLEKVEIKKIDNPETIPSLQKALNASFQRSAQTDCPFNFHSLLRSMAQFSKDIVMLGFFFKETITEPKAFITGIKHGPVVEFSVGGSLSEPELRQYPFNHQLMWQLVLQSKNNGATFLDMGGINTQALLGITTFKRFFPGFELSVGREMEISLRPNYLLLYSMIQNIFRKIKNIFSHS
jgi:hypothetical protein